MKPHKDAQTRIMADLLAKTALQDKKAFARLYRLVSPKLFAVSLRILKQESPAQDCLQEAFISIWQKAGSYQPGLAAPMTWMTTIVRNRAIDQMRKQSRDAYSEESEIELANTASVNPFNTDYMSVSHCLAELKTEQRECIQKAYLDGLTHRELAERMSSPVGTIKTWIHRGLMQLRECLER